MQAHIGTKKQLGGWNISEITNSAMLSEFEHVVKHKVPKFTASKDESEWYCSSGGNNEPYLHQLESEPV